MNVTRFNQKEATTVLHKVLNARCHMIPEYNGRIADPFVSYFCYFSDEVFDLHYAMTYCNAVGLAKVVDNHYENIMQIVSLLRSECSNYVEEADGCGRWIFESYGFSITDPHPTRNARSAMIHKGLWLYEYIDSIPDYVPSKGIITGNDIIRVFDKLNAKPNALATKPKQILVLESILGVKATRHELLFGRWCVHLPGYVIVSCNPFGLDCGLSNSANNFDVLFHDDNRVNFGKFEKLRDLFMVHTNKIKPPVIAQFNEFISKHGITVNGFCPVKQ